MRSPENAHALKLDAFLARYGDGSCAGTSGGARLHFPRPGTMPAQASRRRRALARVLPRSPALDEYRVPGRKRSQSKPISRARWSSLSRIGYNLWFSEIESGA